MKNDDYEVMNKYLEVKKKVRTEMKLGRGVPYI